MGPTYRDRALLLEDTLILADLHVGKGARANLELPVGDGADVLERFEALVSRLNPGTAVVAGDLLHSFGTIPRTVTETVASLQQIGRDHDVPVVVTQGNHDALLESVWDGPIVEEFRTGDTVILHGHRAPEESADRYVIGHDHPTIEIAGRRRPCYLVGEGVYDGADVTVLPPFNRLVQGVRVNEMRGGDFRSPLVRSADAFRPVVRDPDGNETLHFPPLGEFRELL